MEEEEEDADAEEYQMLLEKLAELNDNHEHLAEGSASGKSLQSKFENNVRLDFMQ